MLSRFALVIAVGAVLLHAPAAVFTARCCSHPVSPQAFADGCCAATACCVISDGTAEKPITPAPVANQLLAVSAPVCLVSLIDFPAGPQLARPARAQLVAHAPPPLALSCIFLI